LPLSKLKRGNRRFRYTRLRRKIILRGCQNGAGGAALRWGHVSTLQF